MDGGASPSHCLMNDHHWFRQIDCVIITAGHDLQAWSLPAPKSMNVKNPASGGKVLALTGWYLLASWGRVRMSQSIWPRWRSGRRAGDSSPTSVKLSVEEKEGCFSLPFSSWPSQLELLSTQSVVDTSKSFQGKIAKSGNKIRWKMRLPKKKDTQHQPLLPAASPLPSFSSPASLLFSGFLTYASEIRDCHQGH